MLYIQLTLISTAGMQYNYSSNDALGTNQPKLTKRQPTSRAYSCSANLLRASAVNEKKSTLLYGLLLSLENRRYVL